MFTVRGLRAPLVGLLLLLAAWRVIIVAAAAGSISSCTHQLGPVGLGGRNLDASYNDSSLNMTRCCSACDAHRDCRGWTLNRKQLKCLLKSEVSGRRVHGPQYVASGLSAVAPSPPPLPPPTPPPPNAKNILFVPMDDQRPSMAKG